MTSAPGGRPSASAASQRRSCAPVEQSLTGPGTTRCSKQSTNLVSVAAWSSDPSPVYTPGVRYFDHADTGDTRRGRPARARRNGGSDGSGLYTRGIRHACARSSGRWRGPGDPVESSVPGVSAKGG